jgi:hypothetical protein
MALYRLVCALGQQSLVTVLTRCGLPLPLYFLADAKHSRCLAEKVYLPTIVSGRVLWHLGYTEEASAAAFTQSYRLLRCNRAILGGSLVRGHQRGRRLSGTSAANVWMRHGVLRRQDERRVPTLPHQCQPFSACSYLLHFLQVTTNASCIRAESSGAQNVSKSPKKPIRRRILIA